MKRPMDGSARGRRVRGRRVSLHAQTHFASFTGTVTSSDGVPVPNVEVVATNQATQVTYTARSNDRGPLHHLGAADRHLQSRGTGAELPGLRDQPDQARVGPERARRHHAAGGRRPRRSRSPGSRPSCRRRTPWSARSSRRRRSSGMPLNGRNFSQLSLLLPGRHHHRARQLHRAEELRRRAARTSTASASRKTTTCSTAWT